MNRILMGVFIFLCSKGNAAERPPQYVALAFDNCAEVSRWDNLNQFSEEMKNLGKPVHFTFFVSGTNFITEEDKDTYQAPHHEPGQADIDFSTDETEILNRLKYMHELHDSGHELAAHGIGHVSGKDWSAQDWLTELSNYGALFLKVFKDAGYEDADELAAEVKGFRAPYLDTSPGLYTALKKLGYRYDTSNDDDANEWPRKGPEGLWRFNLADLTVAGTSEKTLSMDYNFYVAQSGTRDIVAKEDLFKDQMVETYMNYFYENYYGNRAPLHIGHHFSPYQGGVYHEALQEFAKQVCGLPEVRCVSYHELADYMDSIDPETLKEFQDADFDHLKR